MIKQTLSNWRVMGSMAYQGDFSKHIQQGVELPVITNWIDAKVPGSIYTDLQKANLIDDPYFGMNSLNCEWVANRWWTYKTNFSLDKNDLDKILKIDFSGIDYSAQIFLNGKKLGSHEGMYLPFTAIINEYAVEGENILVCIIEHAPFADAQPGYTSKTKYMKARFNYKWDFATRLVNLGLYDKVTLCEYETAEIDYHFARPRKVNDAFVIDLEVEVIGYQDAEIELNFEYSYSYSKNKNTEISNNLVTDKIKIKKGYNIYKKTIPVTNFPDLWFPNGYGQQPLCDYSIFINSNNKTTDKITGRLGFRTLEFICADGRDDALPYSIVVNDKRVYIKGTNVVPLCHMQGNVDEKMLLNRLDAIKECNINYVRIWGGGHIESEAFYNKCDEYGIMVMQEFIMSSSGCDDVPSKNHHFLKLLHKVAVHNVKIKRNHVSLTTMDAGNELTDEKYLGCDDHEAHPATYEDSTVAMLKGIVNNLCPDIMFFPSSASGPNALLTQNDIGNNHDVHGPWGYMGVIEHYTLYNNSDSILHSEFGCGGISNYSSLSKFLKKEDLKHCTSHTNNTWRHHGAGWDSYGLREQLMFGDLTSIPFEDYIKINQYVQAESLRYSLEANRRRIWSNVGEMTWQFNEPWPNVQCSNVVDYYGEKKLAFYYMRDAYKSVLTSLKYHKLFYKPNEIFDAEISIINDSKTCDYAINYTVTSCKGECFESGTFVGEAKEDVCIFAGKISVSLPAKISGGFIIKLETTCGSFVDTKEYLMLIADKKLPIKLHENDVLSNKLFTNKKFTNGLDDLRTDYKTVLDFVNKMKL